MKQNQYLNKIVKGAKPQIKHHDFLDLKACCTCSQCQTIKNKVNPEIALDQELIKLRQQTVSKAKECDFIFFLHKLQATAKHLPKFRFLDTVVLKDGEPFYALNFEGGKLKLSHHQIGIKNWIISRKESLDLNYQIKKHQRENDFNFTAFEHKCQKKIKQFQNNIKYKTPGVLNRTAIVKLKNNPLEVVISKTQFNNMFDITKTKVFNMKEIQYMQVFPIMTGEEEDSYIKTIKYFRDKECGKKGFHLAQMFVACWKEKNDSIQKLEENVEEDIKKGEGLEEFTEENRLFYQTYKLFIYFQEISNIRIEQAVLHYITNDNGKSFFFKSLQCLKTQKRASVQDIDLELPAKRDIAVQDYIHLPTSMKSLYEGFQTQYQRLDNEWQQMQSKMRKDRQYSNFVFKTILNKQTDNFHEILSSKNMKYKKSQLNL